MNHASSDWECCAARPAAPMGALITKGILTWPPIMNRSFAAWLQMGSMAQVRKR